MNKKNKNNGSLKGKRYGVVGAPPKPVNWPKGKFTFATIFARNTKQCHLSIRTKVEAAVVGGDVIALTPKKQPGGKVGRPADVFILTANFDGATMTRKGETPVKTVKVKTKKRTVRKVKAVTEPVVVVDTFTTPADIGARELVPASPAPEAAPVEAPVTEAVTQETAPTVA